MITLTVAGACALYIVGCYLWGYREFIKKTSPYGFGIIMFPFSPLMLPMIFMYGALHKVKAVWDAILHG